MKARQATQIRLVRFQRFCGFNVNMYLGFCVVLCMMGEPLLNSACLSALKLTKVGVITLSLIIFMQQRPSGSGFLSSGARSMIGSLGDKI